MATANDCTVDFVRMSPCLFFYFSLLVCIFAFGSISLSISFSVSLSRCFTRYFSFSFTDISKFQCHSAATDVQGGTNANGKYGKQSGTIADAYSGMYGQSLFHSEAKRGYFFLPGLTLVASYSLTSDFFSSYLFQGIKRKLEILPPAVSKANSGVETPSQPILPTLKSLIVTFDCRKVRWHNAGSSFSAGHSFSSLSNNESFWNLFCFRYKSVT